MGHSRRFAATAVVAALAVAISTFASPLAMAAPILADPPPEDITAVATLTKDASVSEVAPGETFTYTLTVGCSAITDLGCRGAVLNDVVPAPFVVVDAVVGAGINSAAAPVIAGNSVTVTWTTPLGDGTVGILDASTGIVEITAQLPADASYDVSGVPVQNDATIEGMNFADDDAFAVVTPVVPLDLVTTATKAFTPAEAIATPGAPVSAALGGTNTSNGTVDSLAIQDPVDPDASPNPFDSLAFAGFGTVTPPPGADPALTTYQVYVDGAWVEAPGGALPAGVTPDEVKGTRVTFNGAIPEGASGSVALNLTVTDAAASAPDGTVVPNDVQSIVGLDGDTATGEASANFTLRQNAVTVGASKVFDPNLVIAGEPTTVTIGGTNTSTIPIDSLTLTEPSTGSFPAEYTFGGFTGPVAWPAGATSGTVVYHLADGSTQSVAFANGATPALPAGVDAADVTSFDLVFTGAIPPGASTTAPFAVDTDPTLTGLPLTVPNTVGVTGENDGATGSAEATDPLYIYDERLEPYIDKQIRPSPIIAAPGQIATVTLNGGLTERPVPPDTTTGTTGRADQIVIQDPEDPVEGDPWWNAFDLTAITQTPVPGDSTLTIEYYDTTTGTWETLAGPIAGPTIYSQQVPADISEVAGGVRFVYDYTGDDGGFAPGTDLSPSFTSSLAR